MRVIAASPAGCWWRNRYRAVSHQSQQTDSPTPTTDRRSLLSFVAVFALSTADMVVQRRDGPRRLREIDDDDDVFALVSVLQI